MHNPTTAAAARQYPIRSMSPTITGHCRQGGPGPSLMVRFRLGVGSQEPVTIRSVATRSTRTGRIGRYPKSGSERRQ